MKKIYVLIISVILIVILAVSLKLNNLEVRPKIGSIIILVLISLYFLLRFKNKKNVIYFILFSLTIIRLAYIQKNHTIENITIINNIKLVKVKEIGKSSFEYHKYINCFFMSKDIMMIDNYSIDNSNNGEVYTQYYNELLKENDDIKISICDRKSYNLVEVENDRIALSLQSNSDLDNFNSKKYILEKLEYVDFSKYDILIISYNKEEVIPYYIGILQGDINLIIKNKKNKNFDKLLVLQIEKKEFDDIKLSDFSTYSNPVI